MDSDKNVGGQEDAAQTAVNVAATAASETPVAPDLATKPQAKPESSRKDKLSLADLKPGQTFQGRVRNVVDFGAFVDIGVGRDGLAHISVLKRAGIDKTLAVGDTLEVAIRRVDVQNNRISLTVPGAGGDNDSKAALSSLKRDAVVTGRVVRLVDFGAFVDVGAQTDGLVHVSELPWGYVNNPAEVLKVGEEVQVRILEVDSRKRRISLSMKGTAQEAMEAVTQDDEPEGNYPTAFEIAFEEARQNLKRRQRRARG